MAETVFALGRFVGMAESTAPETQTVQIAKETADIERKEIKKTAGAIKESAVELVDSADRTTQLAADRTILAAERTYAAWVRTGLAALASGVGAKALLTDVIAEWMVIGAGTVLTLFSAFCFLAGVWRNLFSVRPPKPDIQRLPTWLLLIVNGLSRWWRWQRSPASGYRCSSCCRRQGRPTPPAKSCAASVWSLIFTVALGSREAKARAGHSCTVFEPFDKLQGRQAVARLAKAWSRRG